MKILVLTSCTRRKRLPAELTWKDFERGPEWIRQLEARKSLLPAEQMYTGDQHVRLMRGVRAARTTGISVGVWILSAGYGLLEGHRKIASYEASFLKLGNREFQRRVKFLGLAQKIPQLLNRLGFDLKLILLGKQYLETFSLADLTSRSPTLIVGSSENLDALPSPVGLNKIILKTEDTKNFHCGLVGLKGEVANRIFRRLASPEILTPGALNKAMLQTQWTGPRRYSLF